MRFVTFRNSKGAAEAGEVLNDHVIGLAGAGYADILQVLGGGDAALQAVKTWILNPDQASVYPLVSAKLMAPVPKPPKLICVGLNYRDHAIESNMAITERTTIFSKFSNCVISPGDSIVI